MQILLRLHYHVMCTSISISHFVRVRGTERAGKINCLTNKAYKKEVNALLDMEVNVTNETLNQRVELA